VSEAPASAPLRLADVLAIAVPMTLGYLTTPLVGLVATAVVGRLGDPVAIGGVALGAIVCDLVFSIFYFLRAGTTALTAQAHGRGDAIERRAVLARAGLLALVAGLAIVLLRGPIVGFGVAVVGGEDAVRAATRDYAEIRLLAAPLILANQAIFGWYLGQGRAMVGLLLQLVLNTANIVLAILFVSSWGEGVAGVAKASLVAEAIALAVAVALSAARASGPWPERRRILDLAALSGLAAINRDIMIRTAVLIAAFAFFARQGAGQGAAILAANAVLEKLFLFVSYFLDGFAAAAETFVGRAVGARDRAAFDRAVSLTTRGGFALAAFASVVLALAGGTAIDWMTTSVEVREEALRFLPWAVATPLAGVLAFEMDGVFIGATWTRDMARMMVASLVVYLALWAVLFPLFGNHGLWAAFLAFLGMRGLSLSMLVPRRAKASFARP